MADDLDVEELLEATYNKSGTMEVTTTPHTRLNALSQALGYSI